MRPIDRARESRGAALLENSARDSRVAVGVEVGAAGAEELPRIALLNPVENPRADVYELDLRSREPLDQRLERPLPGSAEVLQVAAVRDRDHERTPAAL